MTAVYAKRVIWDLTVDLAFDCFWWCDRFPNPSVNPVAVRLRAAVAGSMDHVRAAFKNLRQTGAAEDVFATARLCLDDLELQLQIACGMGLLDSRYSQRLERLVQALSLLLAPVSKRSSAAL